MKNNRNDPGERVDTMAFIERHGLFCLRFAFLDPLADLLQFGLDHLHLMLGDHRAMTEREHKEPDEYRQKDHREPQIMER